MRSDRLVLSLAFWIAPALALAQPGANLVGLLGAMEDAYERLDHTAAEQRAREALASYDLLTADQVVRVHTTLGLILYARNEPLEAREQFGAALSLNPALRLDPVLVSPKTLEFFEALKAEAAVSGRPVRAAEIRYVRVRDPRPAAALRSFAVPGWGQVYKGEAVKGWALAGAWAVLAGGTVAAHIGRNGAREDYLSATEQSEIEARYATYNRWHRARSVFALGTLGVWTYAAIDALVSDSPVERGLVVAPLWADGRLGVRMRVRLGPR